MTKRFNLLDEPWIPVRFDSGEMREVGLLELFARAGEIATLADTSPPNLIALYRLLLAVTHRALLRSNGSWKDRDRAEWYRNGLPADAIHDYLEHWRERFWLFHPECPFMQVAALADAEETRRDETLKPCSQLQLECISGDTLFEHRMDAMPRVVSPSEAVRLLLGYLQFVPGGMVRRFRFRDESGPLDNVAAIMPIGNSVDQSLCLALGVPAKSADLDLASWEKPQVSAQDIRDARPTLPTGPIDTYTRITRAVLFESEGSSLVRWLRFGPGLTMDTHNPAFPDRMAAYRKRNGDRISPITFQDGRAFWRDLPALLPVDGTAYIAPPVLEYASGCLLFAMSDTPIRFLAAGTASDPVRCKVFRWRMETLTLPHSIYSDTSLASELRHHIELSEHIYFRKGGLSHIAGDLIAESMPDPTNPDTQTRARKVREAGPCASTYFTTVERFLPSLLGHIARTELDEADAIWRIALVEGVQASWSAVTRGLGQSAAALRAEAVSHWKLQRLLRELRGDATTETTTKHAARSTPAEELQP